MSSNKPFPSSDLDVFKDNSLILDNFVNSQENEYPDRFARKRPTITGIIKEAFNVRTDISNMNETLIGQSRWDVVPKNTSLSLGGDNGALNKQAQALFNRTVMLKVHTREALRRTYLEAGYNLVDGSFEVGGTLVNANDVLLHESSGKGYGWSGAFPKVVSAGSGVSGFVDKSGDLLRDNIFFANKVDATNYLPDGYVTDGSVDYTTHLQSALNYATASNKVLVLPNFPVAVSPNKSTGFCIQVRDGANIEFLNRSSLDIIPNSLANYEIISIRDASDIFISNPVINGDATTHTGVAGEWGMGISIRGMCKNINITGVAHINKCWGDGVYIGQNGGASPSNIRFEKLRTYGCRRQGVSLISVDGLDIDSLELWNTTDAGSPAPLPNGPCAGLDIEPNDGSAILNNIRIGSLSGGSNRGGLLHVYLGAVTTPTAVDRFHVNVDIGSIIDNGSRNAIRADGVNKDVLYSGQIRVGYLHSNNAKETPIALIKWKGAGGLPLHIGQLQANNWNIPQTGAVRTRVAIAIAVYGVGAGEFPSVGSLYIDSVKLFSSVTPSLLYGSWLLVENSARTGVSNVRIGLDSIYCGKEQMIESAAGFVDVNFNGKFGYCGSRLISASVPLFYQYIQGDYSVIPSSTEPTISLPDTIDRNNVGAKFRFKFKNGGTATTMQFRSLIVPMFVNGIQHKTIRCNELTGVFSVEVGDAAYYVVTQGPFIAVN